MSNDERESSFTPRFLFIIMQLLCGCFTASYKDSNLLCERFCRRMKRMDKIWVFVPIYHIHSPTKSVTLIGHYSKGRIAISFFGIRTPTNCNCYPSSNH